MYRETYTQYYPNVYPINTRALASMHPIRAAHIAIMTANAVPMYGPENAKLYWLTLSLAFEEQDNAENR